MSQAVMVRFGENRVRNWQEGPLLMCVEENDEGSKCWYARTWEGDWTLFRMESAGRPTELVSKPRVRVSLRRSLVVARVEWGDGMKEWLVQTDEPSRRQSGEWCWRPAREERVGQPVSFEGMP